MLDSSSDSQESADDSGPKLATGVCLTCLETEEAAVNSVCKNVPEESTDLLQHC